MSVRVERIGNATLYFARCEDVLPMLGGVDACITDPPFGIGIDPSIRRPTKWQRRAGAEARTWDMQRISAGLLSEIRAKGARGCALWGGNYYADLLPASRGWLVWHKPGAVPSMANAELCWTSLDQNTLQIAHSIGATNAERCGHPTQKPERVMRWTIEQFSDAEVILDPFMGSGTTGVACARLGRKFIGIECHEPYFDIACRRIEQAQRQGDLLRDMPQAEDSTDARMADMFAGDAA